MKKILVILMLALAACHPAPEKPSDGKVKGEGFPESSASLSKWVRVNVGDFWAFERQHNPLSSFADAEGIVMGDTHLANFAPIPVRLTNGATQMRYLDIDFDDAGRAPFAYDFLRLVVTTKATKRDVKAKELVDSYIRGLTGGAPVAAPVDIAENLSMTGDDYTKLLSKDIDTKTSAGKFKMKPGKIEPYTGSLTIPQASALLPGYTILDLAVRPVDEETDDGQARIWIYAKDQLNRDRLFELKAYVPSRLSAWEPQLARADWFEDVRANLWSTDIARGEYELIEVAGLGPHWLREKKLTLIDVPYSAQDKKAVLLVRNLGNYDAYTLGLLHARQPSSAALAEKLRNPVDRGVFEEQVKEAAKAYLASVAARVY